MPIEIAQIPHAYGEAGRIPRTPYVDAQVSLPMPVAGQASSIPLFSIPMAYYTATTVTQLAYPEFLRMLNGSQMTAAHGLVLPQNGVIAWITGSGNPGSSGLRIYDQGAVVWDLGTQPWGGVVNLNYGLSNTSAISFELYDFGGGGTLATNLIVSMGVRWLYD